MPKAKSKTTTASPPRVEAALAKMNMLELFAVFVSSEACADAVTGMITSPGGLRPQEGLANHTIAMLHYSRSSKREARRYAAGNRVMSPCEEGKV